MKIVFILLLYTSPIWTTSKGLRPRIIGGEEAFAGEFPYAAAVYKTTADGRYFCTGSLLNGQWVITAGQCVDGAISFTVLLGTHILSGDEASIQRLATDSYALHPDYNPNTLENDIGLIRFRAPIQDSPYINNLYLPYAPFTNSGTTGTAYGWGQTSDEASGISDVLNKATLTAVSDAECRLVYGNQITENMVCFAGSYNQGTCFGDSGSPVTHYISRGYIIVSAIASFFSANGCESTDPSEYTKVYPYNEWINSVIKA